jgi:hypothetical protein
MMEYAATPIHETAEESTTMRTAVTCGRGVAKTLVWLFRAAKFLLLTISRTLKNDGMQLTGYVS